MPHDSHTTHEPDRVGREDVEIARGTGRDDTFDRQPTLLMLGESGRFERELTLAQN